MNQFRVLLCSDSPLYNQSLTVAFEENHSFRVVDQVSQEDLINASLRVQPDVVILKVDDAEGLSCIVELKSQCPFLFPIMIVEDPNQFNLFDLISGGVRGCLPLRMLPRQIVNAIELIVVAGILCLPRLNPRVVNHANGGREKEQTNINALTSREREVLSFLGKSLSNQEIAASLCLSESTVKTHLRNAFKKLKVRNRTEALAVLLGSDVLKQEQLAYRNHI